MLVGRGVVSGDHGLMARGAGGHWTFWRMGERARWIVAVVTCCARAGQHSGLCLLSGGWILTAPPNCVPYCASALFCALLPSIPFSPLMLPWVSLPTTLPSDRASTG